MKYQICMKVRTKMQGNSVMCGVVHTDFPLEPVVFYPIFLVCDLCLPAALLHAKEHVLRTIKYCPYTFVIYDNSMTSRAIITEAKQLINPRSTIDLYTPIH